jgi:hypothetical protein
MCRSVSITLSLFLTWTVAAQQIPVEGITRPLEQVLLDSSALKGITKDQLAAMPLDDPLLRLAYSDLFHSEVVDTFDPKRLSAEARAALEDIRARGDAVTPLLLDMMAKNQYTPLESVILYFVPEIGRIQLAPFLNYARQTIRTRTFEISSSTAGSCAHLLAYHGEENDVALLRWLSETRPYVAPDVSSKIQVIERRLLIKSPTENRVGRANSLNLRPTTEAEPAPTSPKPTLPNEEPTSSKPWSVIIVLIVAAIGLLWLLVKKRK